MSILAAVNFTDNFQDIIEQAVIQAKALREKLILIHIEHLDTVYLAEGAPVPYLAKLTEENLEEDKKILNEQVTKLKADGVDVDYILERGAVCQKIVEKAREIGARMIVIGSHGHTLLINLLTGSTHEGVLYQAECPVLVVPLKKQPT